ncbi:MAG TPA: ADOP family duplicated permease [Vicinamibacterales bacterium]|nr:ADOP family duplicated permease [Vicinamibacterales bacterium]
MFQLRVALRTLWQQPSFFATAVGALALGIAAPTALFAVVQATMLRPLPYANAGDLYTVRTTMTDGRFTIGLVASEELASLRRATDLVANAALVARTDDSLGGDGADARQVIMHFVSEGFFDVFGVPMAMGRAFTPEDHRSTTVLPAVVSGKAWRTLFAADPAIVGKTIHLASNGSAVVVGVAPEAFDAPHDTDLWIASHWEETIGHGFDAYVRLRPGTQATTVQGALGPMWDSLAKKYPDQAKNRIFVLRPLLSAIVGDLGPTALIAFAATALLLVLAIANVANLLLARGAARARDLAVRVAIGASRWHLIQQLLAESMVIAVAAAAIGIPLAYGAVRAIVAIGGDALPRADGLRFDPLVALFATGVMVLAGVTVGLLPALTTADVRLMSVANEGGRGGMQSARTRRLLATLVVCEVSLAIALVAGAGRLLLSARNLLAVDPGFSADGRLIVDALLPREPYRDVARARAWSADLKRTLQGLGATQVGMATSLPLRREWDSTTFTDIVGRPVDPQFRPNGRARIVSPELFQTLGIRVTRGRGFTTDDRTDGQPVVLVNEAWVTKFLPAGSDPLTEQIANLFFRRVDNKTEMQPARIIGVVGNVRYSSLDKAAEPVLYYVDSQRLSPRQSYVITTADGHPETRLSEIRAALKKLDPNVPLKFEMMSDVVSDSLVWSRLGVLLMSTFGIVSLLLAGTGVFGVLAFVGAQRHGEMAVRLSLGATRGGVFRLMLAQGARFALLGGVIGTGLAWWMGRLMSGYVYQVSAANALVLGGSALIVIAVALAATFGPARRASAVQPSEALRP